MVVSRYHGTSIWMLLRLGNVSLRKTRFPRRSFGSSIRETLGLTVLEGDMKLLTQTKLKRTGTIACLA